MVSTFGLFVLTRRRKISLFHQFSELKFLCVCFRGGGGGEGEGVLGVGCPLLLMEIFRFKALVNHFHARNERIFSHFNCLSSELEQV
jgi:hypothetical protein